MLDTVDNLIILYESNETEYETQGLGVLTDASVAKATEESNSRFEVSFEYPVNGVHFDDIQLRRIVLCNYTPFSSKQPFRIYSISRPIKGLITVNAQHISYDLSDCPIIPDASTSVSLSNPQQIWSIIETQWSMFMGYSIPFEFESNITLQEPVEYVIEEPMTAKALLGDGDKSMISLFSGEFEYGYNPVTNKFVIQLHAIRGRNPVPDDPEEEYRSYPEIRYGKNMTDVKQEEKCSNVCTHVLPYYKSGDTAVYLTDYLIEVIQNASYKKILPVNLSSEFDDPPSQEALLLAAQKYITANNIGKPEVNLTVSFVMLSMSEEYREYAILENVNLGDFVLVKFVKMGIQSWARVSATEYDILTMKYTKVSLSQDGSVSATLASTIANVNSNTKNVTQHVYKSAIGQALDKAAKTITGTKGGYITLRNSSGAAVPPALPDQLLVLDKPDINEADNVWMWNKAGLVHFDDYNGVQVPNVAITQEGEINADFIRAGKMSGERIEAGTIDGGAIVAGSIEASRLNIITAGKNYVKNSAGLTFEYSSEVNVPKWSQNVINVQVADTFGHMNSGGSMEAFERSLSYGASSGSFIKIFPNSSSTAHNALYQTVNVVAGQTYSFSFLYTMVGTNTNGYFKLFVCDGEFKDDYEILPDGIWTKTISSYDWEKQEAYFVAPSSGLVTIVLEAYLNYGYVSDIMLAQGSIMSQWSQAANEVYTSNVLIDEDGIEVSKSGSETRTKITNENFKVYYSEEERININALATTLDRTTIKNALRFSHSEGTAEEPLYVERAVAVPTKYGLNFYVSSEID